VVIIVEKLNVTVIVLFSVMK